MPSILNLGTRRKWVIRCMPQPLYPTMIPWYELDNPYQESNPNFLVIQQMANALYIYTQTHARTHTPTHVHAHTHTHMHTRAHTRAHTHTHARARTHTHTLSLSLSFSLSLFSKCCGESIALKITLVMLIMTSISCVT